MLKVYVYFYKKVIINVSFVTLIGFGVFVFFIVTTKDSLNTGRRTDSFKVMFLHY
jgi:hypothetical protein